MNFNLTMACVPATPGNRAGYVANVTILVRNKIYDVRIDCPLTGEFQKLPWVR